MNQVFEVKVIELLRVSIIDLLEGRLRFKKCFEEITVYECLDGPEEFEAPFQYPLIFQEFLRLFFDFINLLFRERGQHEAEHIENDSCETLKLLFVEGRVDRTHNPNLFTEGLQHTHEDVLFLQEILRLQVDTDEADAKQHLAGTLGVGIAWHREHAIARKLTQRALEGRVIFESLLTTFVVCSMVAADEKQGCFLRVPQLRINQIGLTEVGQIAQNFLLFAVAAPADHAVLHVGGSDLGLFFHLVAELFQEFILFVFEFVQSLLLPFLQIFFLQFLHFFFCLLAQFAPQAENVFDLCQESVVFFGMACQDQLAHLFPEASYCLVPLHLCTVDLDQLEDIPQELDRDQSVQKSAGVLLAIHELRLGARLLFGQGPVELLFGVGVGDFEAAGVEGHADGWGVFLFRQVLFGHLIELAVFQQNLIIHKSQEVVFYLLELFSGHRPQALQDSAQVVLPHRLQFRVVDLECMGSNQKLRGRHDSFCENRHQIYEATDEFLNQPLGLLLREPLDGLVQHILDGRGRVATGFMQHHHHLVDKQIIEVDAGLARLDVEGEIVVEIAALGEGDRKFKQAPQHPPEVDLHEVLQPLLWDFQLLRQHLKRELINVTICERKQPHADNPVIWQNNLVAAI